jgi:hypothetical protein
LTILSGYLRTLIERKTPTGQNLEASLTAKQYRRHIKQLGLNLSSAADFLDISYRTSRRLGDTTADAPIPRAVAMVLRLALRYQIKPEVMVDKFGD